MADSCKDTSEFASSPTKKSPAHLILQNLPTPARGSPRSKEMFGDRTPKSQGGNLVGRFGMISANVTTQPGIARGSEPWDLPDIAAAPQSSQKCGYHLRLQARGQQAMQRSLIPGITSRSSTAAAMTTATPAPAQALPPSPGPATLGINAGASTMFGGLATPPSNLHPLPVQTVSSTVPNDFQTQWLGSTTMEMQAMINQQAMMPCYMQPTPVMLCSNSNCNQLFPMTSIACQQAPETSATSQNGMKTFGNGFWCQVDLMATLMPQALSLNQEEIAEQLRQAAPWNYDD